ncbi:MAG: F0F1 ATP synthase subunit A [Clostridia bacterium]|nr:F0F1 ATP synthase subunit A [Clostridia bacterium]
MILPLVFCIVLKVLTKPLSEGIDISGALVYFTIKMPIQDLPVTESQVNSLMVMISILGLCLYLTHGMGKGQLKTRHHIAEFLVGKADGLVKSNMDEHFRNFGPFITAILALSAFSSLISLLGLYPPTSDVNIVGGWAIVVFVLITYYKAICGPVQYIKSFCDPVLLAPLNIISEVATPISMAFRHYGNVLSGAVISVLVATGLQGLSKMIFSFLPGFLGNIPFLQIGLPAILSIYFDVFSGLLQAYIFAMLTMLYISGGFPAELFNKKKIKKI